MEDYFKIRDLTGGLAYAIGYLGTVDERGLTKEQCLELKDTLDELRKREGTA